MLLAGEAAPAQWAQNVKPCCSACAIRQCYYNCNNTGVAPWWNSRSASSATRWVWCSREVIHRLRTEDGERLFLIEDAEGGYRLTPYDPAFEKKMKKAEEIMGRYRNTLRALAK